MTTSPRRKDSQQLVRQWAILRLLTRAARGYSIKELADQLAASKQCIDRDIATLDQEFALIAEVEGKQKKLYRVTSEIKALEGLRFGAMELHAIHAALSMTSAMARTPMHNDLTSVMRKIRGLLSERHNGGLSALAGVVAPHVRGAVDYSQHGDLVDSIADAIARRRWCQAEYRKPGAQDAKTYNMRPLKLVWHRRALYLLASLEGYNDITTFAVQRFTSFGDRGDEFAPPKLDVTGFIGKAFGIFVSDDEVDVEIVFDAEIAWMVEERTYHPAETKEKLSDGRVRYRVRSSAQWEVVPWVLSFAGRAELVAPSEWRAVVEECATTMHRRHQA